MYRVCVYMWLVVAALVSLMHDLANDSLTNTIFTSWYTSLTCKFMYSTYNT